jgi:hypothetical protein
LTNISRRQIIQRRWKIDVSIRHFPLSAKSFESLHDCLAQRALNIPFSATIEDSTARKTVRINATLVTDVVRTSARWHRLHVLRPKIRSKVKQLGRGNIQPVVEMLEVTAPATGLTTAQQMTMRVNLRLPPVVYLRNGLHDRTVYL